MKNKIVINHLIEAHLNEILRLSKSFFLNFRVAWDPKGGKMVVVANYKPRGNIPGQYGKCSIFSK